MIFTLKMGSCPLIHTFWFSRYPPTHSGTYNLFFIMSSTNALLLYLVNVNVSFDSWCEQYNTILSTKHKDEARYSDPFWK